MCRVASSTIGKPAVQRICPPGIERLLESRPEHELAIRRVYRREPEFRAICEDLEAVRRALERMVFTNFYGQPSCTPGRAAIQTGRIPNRSGMTTVAFQGQGGGLPAAEWTLGSVLKEAGYKTYFTGKWHLGESDYALPNAQGYDVMKYAFLYHLNAYTYPDPKWHLAMSHELRQMFEKITTGALSGNAGEKAK
jgi:hypothetical protein